MPDYLDPKLESFDGLVGCIVYVDILYIYVHKSIQVSIYLYSARCCLLRLLRVYVPCMCVCVYAAVDSVLKWFCTAQSLSSKASSALLLVNVQPLLYYTTTNHHYQYTLWDSSVTLQRGSISVVALGVLLLSEDFQDVNETAICVVFVKQYTPLYFGYTYLIILYILGYYQLYHIYFQILKKNTNYYYLLILIQKALLAQ